jgi:3-deoxy-D-arabino-heptulosonate 7-phosphate (DAHP) synthase
VSAAEGEDEHGCERHPGNNQPADRYLRAGMASGTHAIMLRVRDNENAGHKDNDQQSDEQNFRTFIATAEGRQSNTSFPFVP